MRRRLLLHVLRLCRDERIAKIGNNFCDLLDSRLRILLHLVVDFHERLDKSCVQPAVGKKVLTHAAQVGATDLRRHKC